MTLAYRRFYIIEILFSAVATLTHYDSPSRVVTPRACQNTYQLKPTAEFPKDEVLEITKELVNSQLALCKYDPEECRKASKHISEVSSALVIRFTRLLVI